MSIHRKVRITTADNTVRTFEDGNEAIQEYIKLNALGKGPQMTLFDADGKEIPAMTADPDWVIPG